ncbi:MAG: aldo/keto reductase [Austwickia sp.]|nr:aldo/keto reductase [Austwickia sp.]
MTNRPGRVAGPPRRIPALDQVTSAIGLGCMGMSWAYTHQHERDDAAAVALIRAALDRGVTLLDTSDAYGPFHNEQLVGAAIAGRREEAIVATKAGLLASYVDGRPHLERNGRPEHLRAACEASLERLGVDVIDLYYLHRGDPDVPLEESWGALAELVGAGKARALGLSEVSVEEAERAHAVHPVAAVQSELSLWTRDALGEGESADGRPAGDVVGWCRTHDAVFVPFSALGRGFLTGELDAADLPASDFRANLPRFAAEALTANQRIVDVVRRVAARCDVPPAAVALAWVLAQGEHVLPIPGTTKLRHLEANVAAAGLVLGADELAELDAAPPATGSRY